jgi:hypothetical protein
MADEDDVTVVPNTSEPEEERERIRQSNDLDQEMERKGIQTPHNRGYDEAADGVARPPRVIDETEE